MIFETLKFAFVKWYVNKNVYLINNIFGRYTNRDRRHSGGGGKFGWEPLWFVVKKKMVGPWGCRGVLLSKKVFKKNGLLLFRFFLYAVHTTLYRNLIYTLDHKSKELFYDIRVVYYNIGYGSPRAFP